MRAAVVIAVVCMVALCGVAVPQVGLLGYVWYVLMRPDYFSWSSTLFPYAAVLEICTLVGAARFLQNAPVLIFEPLSRWLILLHVPLALSTIWAVNPHLSYGPYFDFLRVTVMVLLIPILIRNEIHLRWLFLVMSVSLGMIGFKFGIWGLMRGGVAFHEGYAGLDNNALAIALVMALPICWVTRQNINSKWLKAALIVMIFSSMATVTMTKSRGGILAMATTLVLLFYRSRHKLWAFALILLLLIPPLYLFRYQFVDRVSTLAEPTEDPSVQARLYHFKLSLRMWRDYWLLGVGFGNENYIMHQSRYTDPREFSELPPESQRPLKVHNSYLQMLVDSGIFAALIFVYLIGNAIVRLQRSAKRWRKENPTFARYAYGLQISLIAFAQYGLSGGRERYDFFYILLMTAATWFLIEKELLRRQTEKEQTGQPARISAGLLLPRPKALPARSFSRSER